MCGGKTANACVKQWSIHCADMHKQHKNHRLKMYRKFTVFEIYIYILDEYLYSKFKTYTHLINI